MSGLASVCSRTSSLDSREAQGGAQSPMARWAEHPRSQASCWSNPLPSLQSSFHSIPPRQLFRAGGQGATFQRGLGSRIGCRAEPS